MKFLTGDNVIVTTGKDKGKVGAIVKIHRNIGKVLVEGINKQVKHRKAQQGQPGERLEIFAPIDISNIQILDPKSKKPTRIGYKIEENGAKVRVAKPSGLEIPAPEKKKKSGPAKVVKA